MTFTTLLLKPQVRRLPFKAMNMSGACSVCMALKLDCLGRRVFFFLFHCSAIAKHLTVSGCASYSDVSSCRIILQRGLRIVEQLAAVLSVLLSDSL